MAQDGSYEVAWKGQAFPYLLHHQGFLRTENYGSERSGAPCSRRHPLCARSTRYQSAMSRIMLLITFLI